MIRRFFLLLALSLPLLPQPALAWSRLGHWLVGDLAEAQLTPQARAAIAKLLAGETDPTLGGIASWADDLRNSDADAFKRTSRWHYVDLDADTCAYDPPHDCEDGECAIAAIDAQRRILADPSQPLAARRDALKFVVHLVGDLHQPLHAADRHDKGGNAFQVSLRTDLQPEAYARKNYVNGVMGTNLHAVWDYYILASAHLSPQAYADKLSAEPLPQVDAADLGTPLSWAQESCRLVEANNIYPRQHRMDSTYLDAMRPLAEQRVRLAAARLAQVLNSTLGS